MNRSCYNSIYIAMFFAAHIISGQEPFLTVKPYAEPEWQQYAIRNHVDHHYPAQMPDGVNVRFDGSSFSENIVAFNCNSGTSCYDGHAGADYHMPLDVPILAAADGYVIWSALSLIHI